MNQKIETKKELFKQTYRIEHSPRYNPDGSIEQYVSQ